LTLLLLAGLVPLSTGAQQPGGKALSAVDLYARYRLRQFGEVSAALERIPDFSMFERDLARLGAAEKPEPRAAFLLEAAAAAFRLERSIAMRPSRLPGTPGSSSKPAAPLSAGMTLFEAACALARESPESTFSRRWNLAALSLIEAQFMAAGGGPAGGLVDNRATSSPFVRHLEHADGHLTPGEILLARALETEQEAWARWHYDLIVVKDATGNAGLARFAAMYVAEWERAVETTLTRLQEARRHEDVRVEATIRLGAMIAMRPTKDSDPVSLFREARKSSTDAWWLYLSHLLEGRWHESRDRLSDAEAAYRAASELQPQAQSARVALAALSYVRGDGEDADRLAREVLAAPPNVHDPWSLYIYGHFFLWPDRLRALRELLQ
jgi:tetratricopeptide (TPR) repeat protein